MSDEILIGEGVVLDARPASFASRLLSGLLDAIVLITVLWVASMLAVAVGAGAGANDAVIAALSVTVVVGVIVVAPATVETLTRGRSVGKLAVGLRIVRDDGGPVRFRHAIIRALVGIFELWMTAGSVALVTSLLHPRGKRLGDVLAGTYSVRIRGGQRPLAPLVMPYRAGRLGAPRRHPAAARRRRAVRPAVPGPGGRPQPGLAGAAGQGARRAGRGLRRAGAAAGHPPRALPGRGARRAPGPRVRPRLAPGGALGRRGAAGRPAAARRARPVLSATGQRPRREKCW